MLKDNFKKHKEEADKQAIPHRRKFVAKTEPEASNTEESTPKAVPIKPKPVSNKQLEEWSEENPHFKTLLGIIKG